MLVPILSIALAGAAPEQALRAADASWSFARIEDLGAITTDVGLSVQSSANTPADPTGLRTITLSPSTSGGVVVETANTGRSSIVQASAALSIRLTILPPGQAN